MNHNEQGEGPTNKHIKSNKHQNMRKFWKKERNTTEEEDPAKTTEPEPVTTTEEEEPEEEASRVRFPRMHAWVALTVSSIVCLIAIAQSKNSDAKLWVLIVSCLSVIFSFLTSVVYCIRRLADKFADKIYEGIVALLVLLFWIGGLPVIMDPDRGIAVTASNKLGLTVVTNANLYFFSWGSFACIVYIFGSYASAHLPDAKEAIASVSATPKLAKWYTLLCASIVVLAASIEYHTSLGCGGKSAEGCNSNKYATSLGVFAIVIAIGIIAAMYINTLNVYVESGTVVIMLGLYTTGVALITFNDGSGTSIGNLYFGTWLGFLVTIFLSVDVFHTCRDVWTKSRAAKKAAPQAASEAGEKVDKRAEVDSDIDENEFYEAKDEESKHFKYFSNA